MSLRAVYACPKCRTVLRYMSYGTCDYVEDFEKAQKDIKALGKKNCNCTNCSWSGTYSEARAA